MLLLTCQYFTSQNSNLGPQQVFQQNSGPGGSQGLGAQATQAQIVNQMRRNRNKNPNCNHNATSVFYQPHYNNVKYDETNQKKEEVLKKVFFKESSKMEDERKNNGPLSNLGGNNPIWQAGAQIVGRPLKSDPLTQLHIIEHLLAESMYIKDITAAIAAGGRHLANL